MMSDTHTHTLGTFSSTRSVLFNRIRSATAICSSASFSVEFSFAETIHLVSVPVSHSHKVMHRTLIELRGDVLCINECDNAVKLEIRSKCRLHLDISLRT